MEPITSEPTELFASDLKIVGAAFCGIIQIVLAASGLYFGMAHLVRFPEHFKQKMILFSLMGCLVLAFTHGCIQSFVLTNVFVSDAESILDDRCEGLFWYQTYILQLGQLLLYIYILSMLQSLKVFKIAMYYFALLLITCTGISTAVILPWYNVPSLYWENDETPDLIMCGEGDTDDYDLFEEYAIVLSVDMAAQCVLLFVFLHKVCMLCAKNDCTFRKDIYIYRILTLGIVVVLFNLADFIYFCVTRKTFYIFSFIIYCIIILLSYKVTAVNKGSNDSILCWCFIRDRSKHEQINISETDDNNVVKARFRLPHNMVAVKEEESIKLI